MAGIAPRLGGAATRLGLPVLDAGCGGGRHLAALRAAGVPALGVDLSPDLLGVAGGRPACAGRLVRGDLRTPPFADGSCAAVALLFTAFGYFDEEGDAACLAALARLLAPGGCLLLDLPEPERVVAGLVPASERRTDAGLVVQERRRLAGRRVEKQVEVRHPDGREVRWTESVRLYARHELDGLTRRAGLEPWESWPGLAGPRADGGRLVWWASRP